MDDRAGEPVRPRAAAAARGRLPDPRLARRGGRRGAGGVAAAAAGRRGEIDNLEGWLTTVVARICLNILRDPPTRARPLDGLCPSRSSTTRGGTDPEHEALLADAVGIALQVVLDALSPAERLAFVLHDMFAVPFDEIAALLDRSPRRPASSPAAPAAACATPRRGRTRT